MNINFAGWPKTAEAKAFEKMFMAGFEPLKNHVQYNKLHAQLTDDDLYLMAHALMAGVGQWCEFLRRLDTEASFRRGHGE